MHESTASELYVIFIAYNAHLIFSDMAADTAASHGKG